jgi:ubiquinone/menaquinone biosynthesis C-methylase UbiE
MSKFFNLIFYRNKHVCPRWLCFSFDNFIRRLFQKPEQILKPYLKDGDTVLDVGPGIGFFTISMARIVGKNGRVIAADLQGKMLAAIKKRGEHAGVQKIIDLHLCSSNSLGVNTEVDFILAFWMVHEVPDKQRFLTELYSLLKDGGSFLLAEPCLHVTKNNFEETICLAKLAGFIVSRNPRISFSRCVLFSKT